MAVVPNPTNGPLRLGLDPARRMDALEVIDALGAVVVRTARPMSNTLDLSSLRPGVYTVRALTQEGVRTARVVRE